MILLLDIGNTRIKWGIAKQGVLHRGGVLLHSEAAIRNLLDEVKQRGEGPQHVVISNVAASHYVDTLSEQLVAHWGCTVELVQTKRAALGVTNGYAEPQTLGVDRWLALIAAHSVSEGALCVVDCGTALTIDLLDQKGVHLGGIIVPGIRLMESALMSNTDGLSQPEGQNVPPLLTAQQTEAGIAGGVRYALVALIDRAAQDAQTLLDEQVTVVLTGGGATEIRSHLHNEVQFEPELVLKGMMMVAEAGG